MPSTPELGIMATPGSRIPELPVGASVEQLRGALSEIIAKLNNFSRDIVATDSVLIQITGPLIETTTIPHNLGYTPRVFAQLDDRSLVTDLSGGLAAHANLALPTGLSYSIGGGVVTIVVWLEVFADDTNLYFRCLNADGSTYPGGLPIKYFLTRDPAN